MRVSTDSSTPHWRRQIAAGAATLALLSLTAAAAPVLAPYPPAQQNLTADLAPPDIGHPLGRDKLGRDVLSRIIYGARVSLAVGLSAVLLYAGLGVLIGATAGFAGGRIDFWVMRLVDILLAFPGILLAIAMTAALGPGLTNVIIALSLIGWTGYARLVRAEVMAVAARDHVEAARALGVPTPALIRRHVLPLIAAPLMVQATFGMAGAIVAEASLSFLGLGVQPPTPSWGAMVNDGRSFLLVAPHLVLYPGIAIFLTVLGLNALGDGVRAYLDVRGR